MTSHQAELQEARDAGRAEAEVSVIAQEVILRDRLLAEAVAETAAQVRSETAAQVRSEAQVRHDKIIAEVKAKADEEAAAKAAAAKELWQREAQQVLGLRAALQEAQAVAESKSKEVMSIQAVDEALMFQVRLEAETPRKPNAWPRYVLLASKTKQDVSRKSCLSPDPLGDRPATPAYVNLRSR